VREQCIDVGNSHITQDHFFCMSGLRKAVFGAIGLCGSEGELQVLSWANRRSRRA